MILTRRAVLRGGAGAVAASALPFVPPLAAATEARGERRFDILRDGDPIGTHLTRVIRTGDRLQVETDVNIVVRVLGIAAYRYELRSHEVWEGGRLISLDGETNDDGDRDVARVRRTDAGLVSEGSWTGALPDRVATTTYWTRAFFDRPIWLSTQSGMPLEVSPTRIGAREVPTPNGPVQAEAWRSEGDLPVTMFYGPNGEWLGNAFDAGGKPVQFVLASDTGPLAPLWTGA